MFSCSLGSVNCRQEELGSKPRGNQRNSLGSGDVLAFKLVERQLLPLRSGVRYSSLGRWMWGQASPRQRPQRSNCVPPGLRWIPSTKWCLSRVLGAVNAKGFGNCM